MNQLTPSKHPFLYTELAVNELAEEPSNSEDNYKNKEMLFAREAFNVQQEHKENGCMCPVCMCVKKETYRYIFYKNGESLNKVLKMIKVSFCLSRGN